MKYTVLWKLPESQNGNDNVAEVLQCLLKRSVNVKLRCKFTELLFSLILSGLVSYHVIDKVSLFSSSSTVLWLLFLPKNKTTAFLSSHVHDINYLNAENKTDITSVYNRLSGSISRAEISRGTAKRE